MRNSGGPINDSSYISSDVNDGSGSEKPAWWRLNVYVGRESDSFIVVKKPANKTESGKADGGGVGGAKGANNKKWRIMSDLTVTQSAAAGSSVLSRLHANVAVRTFCVLDLL